MSFIPPPAAVDISKLIFYTDSLSTIYVRCLVYGMAGVGKTRLLRTTSEPTLILSAEGGLLSLKREHLPAINIPDMGTFYNVYQWLYNGQDQYYFKTIGIDSASEIAETILAAEMKMAKDPRKAYGELANKMMDALRSFRDLPYRNVVFTAKQGRITDQSTGGIMWGPMMPGQQLDQQVPYMFDEVFHLGVYRDQNGQEYSALRTKPDNQYQAKDRSGSLDAWERPNLTEVFTKIKG